MAISAVVFDWYATLAKPNPDDFWTRLADEIAEAGGDPRPDVLAAWDVEHPVEHTRHSTDEATYRAWQRARLDEVFAACGLDGPTRERLLDRIDGQRYTRAYDVFPDVQPTLVELRRRGLTTGLCSNWDWDLDRHLRSTGIAELFDVVVCSAQHGSRKPHESIFATVLDGVGAAPDDVLFVGDSWLDDVTGARAAGLRPVHVVRTGADSCAVTAHDGVPCVSSIADILRLLD